MKEEGCFSLEMRGKRRKPQAHTMKFLFDWNRNIGWNRNLDRQVWGKMV
jgi:hypothetical protein